MVFNSGLKVFENRNKIPIIPSGDKTLNKLIFGGFHLDLLYLIYGEKRIITNILLKTSVNAQIIFNGECSLQDYVKIAYVDGTNYFNPYNISKYALSLRVNPKAVLENILISRVFTWDQMVEVLENQIIKLDIKVILISGITNLFQYEQKGYEDLWKAISGIKTLLHKLKPLIILTAPQNRFSDIKPKGGQIITHFGNVLILIEDNQRKIVYSLIQHPSLPEKTLFKIKPHNSRKKKYKSFQEFKNKTLDRWL